MKVGGQILWNALAICETSQTCCLMGRRPMKDVLGNHSKDLLFNLVHWLSITLFLRKTSQESINLERKFYLDCSSDTLCTRGGIWKGDVLFPSWKLGMHSKKDCSYQTGDLESFTLTIPWNSAKLVKISPGIIARLHHTDQKPMGLLK